MIGTIKKLKDKLGNYIYPITRIESVFVNESKSLDQAIADGTLGIASVSVSGRGYCLFSLRGAIINVRKNTDDNTCSYSFPTLDTDRYRRLFVWTAAATLKTVDIPDGVLLDNDALVYDVSTNTLSTVNASWGNIPLSQDKYLLLYNNLGNIGGILSKYISMGRDSLSCPTREIEAQLISNTGSVQGIFIVGDKLYKCAQSLDDHSDFVNITEVSLANPNTILRTITHNLGHLNAPSYSAARDSLIVGNGSKDYALLPKGWIFPNFTTVIAGTTIDFNTVSKVELDFTQFAGEYKGQLCWGYDSTDIVYLLTNDNRIIRKIQLGKGTNNLGSGVYIDGTATDAYNGSYSVLNTWYSRTADLMGGFMFYRGLLYTGVKGANNIRKCTLLSDGYFNTEYIQVSGYVGDMQGIAITSNTVYAFTDSKGYTFSVNEL